MTPVPRRPSPRGAPSGGRSTRPPQPGRTRQVTGASVLGLVLAALVGAARPGTAGAQAGLAGTVRDGLAAGRPLAGARVELSPTAALASALRVATTDTAGRFAFPGVAPGRYLLGVSHPRLDTLALELPPRVVDVAAEGAPVEVTLAIPDARTLAAAVCGPLDPGRGAVIGRVSDAVSPAPVPTASAATASASTASGTTAAHRPHAARDTLVGAWWVEPPPTPGAPPVDRAVWVPVGAGGRFAICDVPTHAAIRLELVAASPTGAAPTAGTPADGAADADAVSLLAAPTTVTLRNEAPLAFREFVPPAATWPRVGATAAPSRPLDPTAGREATGATDAPAHSTRVTGVVRDADGAPVAAARVSVQLASGDERVARTDARGAFGLADLPPGRHRVVAAAIGYTPGAALVRVAPGGADAADIVLGARVPVLDRVTVRESRIRSDTEFARRMRGITGRYLTGDDVERAGAPTLGTLLGRAQALRQVGVTRGGNPVFAGRREDCRVSVFVDGVELDWDAANQFAPPATIGGVEIYNAPEFAPMPYARRGCAIVLVWTKRAVYR